jgi:hypothetical protein
MLPLMPQLQLHVFPIALRTDNDFDSNEQEQRLHVKKWLRNKD